MSISNDRRSFYGIAPTWRAGGAGSNGTAKPTSIALNVLSVLCELDNEGDIQPINTLAGECEIVSYTTRPEITLIVDCDLEDEGDVQPEITLIAVGSKTSTGDVQPEININALPTIEIPIP